MPVVSGVARRPATGRRAGPVGDRYVRHLGHQLAVGGAAVARPGRRCAGVGLVPRRSERDEVAGGGRGDAEPVPAAPSLASILFVSAWSRAAGAEDGEAGSPSPPDSRTRRPRPEPVTYLRTVLEVAAAAHALSSLSPMASRHSSLFSPAQSSPKQSLQISERSSPSHGHAREAGPSARSLSAAGPGRPPARAARLSSCRAAGSSATVPFKGGATSPRADAAAVGSTASSKQITRSTARQRGPARGSRARQRFSFPCLYILLYWRSRGSKKLVASYYSAKSWIKLGGGAGGGDYTRTQSYTVVHRARTAVSTILWPARSRARYSQAGATSEAAAPRQTRLASSTTSAF